MSPSVRATVRCSKCNALLTPGDVFCRRCDAMGVIGGALALQPSTSDRAIRLLAMAGGGILLAILLGLTTLRIMNSERYDQAVLMLHGGAPTPDDGSGDALSLTRGEDDVERPIRELHIHEAMLDGVDGTTSAIPSGRLIATNIRLAFLPDSIPGTPSRPGFALSYAKLVAVVDSTERIATPSDTSLHPVETLHVRTDEGTITFVLSATTTRTVPAFLGAVDAQRRRAARRVVTPAPAAKPVHDSAAAKDSAHAPAPAASPTGAPAPASPVAPVTPTKP